MLLLLLLFQGRRRGERCRTFTLRSNLRLAPTIAHNHLVTRPLVAFVTMLQQNGFIRTIKSDLLPALQNAVICQKKKLQYEQKKAQNAPVKPDGHTNFLLTHSQTTQCTYPDLGLDLESHQKVVMEIHWGMGTYQDLRLDLHWHEEMVMGLHLGMQKETMKHRMMQLEKKILKEVMGCLRFHILRIPRCR